MNNDEARTVEPASWHSRFSKQGFMALQERPVVTHITKQVTERRKEIQTELALLPGVSDPDREDSRISFSCSLWVYSPPC